MQAYQTYLPSLMNEITSNILPSEQAQLNAQQQLSPQQNQLQLQNYQTFGPQFAQVGANITGQDQLLAAQNATANLNKAGGALGAAEQTANEAVNPQWYQERQQSADALTKLFGSLSDPNTMSGSDIDNISRGLAQMNASQGNENQNATTTAAEGMQFGQAGAALKAQKQSAIEGALGQAGATMGASIDQAANPVAQITGSTPNYGNSQIPMPTAPVGQMATSIGTDMFNAVNNLGMQANQINAARPNGLQNFATVMGSMPNVNCCFIFMEAYGGKMPWFVRLARDLTATKDVRNGYVAMSRWLVPLMRRSKLVRMIVNTLMIKPLTKAAASMTGQGGAPAWMIFKHLWYTIWSITSNFA